MDWQGLVASGQFVADAQWSALSAPFAQRSYVVALCMGLVILALFRARGQKRFLEQVGRDHFRVVIPGPKPRLPKSIQRQLDRIRAEKEKRARAVWLAVAELFALGVMLPAALLALGTLFYAWFDPHVAALLDDRSGAPIRSPAPWQIGFYVSDHLLRGGLFDLMEVFKLHASTITNNREAYGYTIGLFLFHLYVEGFFLFVLIALGKMAFVIPRALRPAST